MGLNDQPKMQSEGGETGRHSQRLAFASVFGVLIFLSKTVIPTPVDKVAVLFQALLLTLGALATRPLGATLASGVGGLLTALWRAPFAPFTLCFALLYGLMIDATFALLRVRSPQGVRTRRLVFAVTLSTTVVGLMSYYVTSIALQVLPRSLVLELAVLVGGIVSGLVGGYLAALLWKDGLRYVKGM
ncbi:MAG: hypothetical protein QW057_06165 [Candidatus Bathyarchaeia archaeon]